MFYYSQRKLGFARTLSGLAAFVPMMLVAEPVFEIANAGVVFKLPLTTSGDHITRWLVAARAGPWNRLTAARASTESGALFAARSAGIL